MAPQIQCKLKYWHLVSGATRRLLCSRKCGLSQCQGRSGLFLPHSSIHRLMCCMCVLHQFLWQGTHIAHIAVLYAHSVVCYMCVLHTLHIQQGCTNLAYIALLHTQCGVLYVCITLLHTLDAHIAHHCHMLDITAQNLYRNVNPCIMYMLITTTVQQSNIALWDKKCLTFGNIYSVYIVKCSMYDVHIALHYRIRNAYIWELIQRGACKMYNVQCSM